MIIGDSGRVKCYGKINLSSTSYSASSWQHR